MDFEHFDIIPFDFDWKEDEGSGDKVVQGIWMNWEETLKEEKE